MIIIGQISIQSLTAHCDFFPQGGTLQLKIGGGGWLDSLGSEILVGKDILGFFKNIDLDNN